MNEEERKTDWNACKASRGSLGRRTDDDEKKEERR